MVIVAHWVNILDCLHRLMFDASKRYYMKDDENYHGYLLLIRKENTNIFSFHQKNEPYIRVKPCDAVLAVLFNLSKSSAIFYLKYTFIQSRDKCI